MTHLWVGNERQKQGQLRVGFAVSHVSNTGRHGAPWFCVLVSMDKNENCTRWFLGELTFRYYLFTLGLFSQCLVESTAGERDELVGANLR